MGIITTEDIYAVYTQSVSDNFFMPYLCQLFFSAAMWGKLCEVFVIVTSLSL